MQGMVELDLFFSNVTDSMMIVAVADMNGDKFTDIITVNQERSAFRVFLYNNHLKEFVFGEREFPVNCIIANIQTIKTSNKNAGLLVTWSKPESIIKTFKYDDDIHDFTELVDKRIRIQRGNQPFIADFDGDFFPDLLYMDDEGIKISSQATNSFKNNFNDVVFKPGVVSDKWLDVVPGRTLVSPGTVAYVDLDGDCIADILLTTKDPSSNQVYIEIYITILGNAETQNTDSNLKTRYWLVKRVPLPEDIDPILLLADFDREGMIDILGYSPSKKSIYIFNNGLKPKTDEVLGLWSQNSALDIGSKIFPALDGDLTVKDSEFVMFHKISKIPYFNALHGHSDLFPPRLRFGDINADGYPDLIATFELSGHNAFPAVLINSPWVVSDVQKCKPGERVFVYSDNKYNEELKKHNDWNYAFFFDIEENGILDIILVVHDVNQRKDRIIPLMSNYDQDSFFLKTKVVSHIDNKADIVMSGATIRASFTQLGDEKYILVGTQRSQESYANLGLSYVYFGIGRSNNYIEAFTVGTLVSEKKVVKSWTPIIPNTQLIVSTQNSRDPHSWQLDLLIGPTKAIGILVVVVLLCLLIIGLIVIILHFAEKAEDEKEQEKAFAFL